MPPHHALEQRHTRGYGESHGPANTDVLPTNPERRGSTRGCVVNSAGSRLPLRMDYKHGVSGLAPPMFAQLEANMPVSTRRLDSRRDSAPTIRARRRLNIVFPVLLSLSLAQVAAAQRIQGSVVLPDSVTPASGVIILAFGPAGAVLGQTLSHEDGSFALLLAAPGTVDLRALRIGQRPTVLSALAVDTGKTTTAHIVLLDAPLALASVGVRKRTSCRIRPDSGELVAKLWQEARKALLATQLTQADASLVATVSTFDRSEDLTGTVALGGQSRIITGPTRKPFASLPADSLAKRGYAVVGHSSTTLIAPDADVLLSESFAGAHCMYVAPAPKEHPAWIGLGFSSTNDNLGYVDVEGTLWLDRASAELQTLEFRYVGLVKKVADANPGGAVHFVRLASGNWFVNSWTIRLPLMTVVRDDNNTTAWKFGEQRTVLDGVQITGGTVRSIVQAGATLYSTGADAAAGSMTTADSLLTSTAMCPDKGDTTAIALLHGVVVDDFNEPVVGATVALSWETSRQCAFDGSCTFQINTTDVITSGAGWWYTCGIARDLPVEVRANIGKRWSRTTTIIVPDDHAVARVDLIVPRK